MVFFDLVWVWAAVKVKFRNPRGKISDQKIALGPGAHESDKTELRSSERVNSDRELMLPTSIQLQCRLG